jgi:hypothetical protein
LPPVERKDAVVIGKDHDRDEGVGGEEGPAAGGSESAAGGRQGQRGDEDRDHGDPWSMELSGVGDVQRPGERAGAEGHGDVVGEGSDDSGDDGVAQAAAGR